MAFRYVPTTLAGVSLGELNAYDRTLRLALNGRLKTASCRVRLDDPLADTLLSGAAMLKVYDDTTLRLVGVLFDVEEVAEGSGGSIRLTFADAYSVLGARLIGKSSTGYADGGPLALVDKTTLVANLLAAANASAYTGLDLGTTTATGSTSYVAHSPYKVAGEAITELVNSLDGPDIEVRPVEPTAVAGGTRIGLLDIEPAIGQARPAAVFEYGVGRRNVASYRRTVSTAGLLNRAYGLPPASRPGAAVVTAQDAGSIATYGVREGVVPSDFAVDELRQQFVDEHVRVRKNPRTVITFTPTRDDPARPGRVPRFGVDYELGDAVPFRAVSQAGTVRVNASMRVYAADFAIDDNGVATPSLTLTTD